MVKKLFSSHLHHLLFYLLLNIVFCRTSPLREEAEPSTTPNTEPVVIAAQTESASMKSKVNLLILPLSASLIFIGLIVSRCYCWMVEDIREHDRNMDGVFSDESLRDQHQADVERISSVRLARRLKRGYSTEDPVPFDSLSDSNSDSPNSNDDTLSPIKGLKRSNTTVKSWLDQVPNNVAQRYTSQSTFFTHTGGVLFLSPRMPLRTRSVTGLHRIPEDRPLGLSTSCIPNLENTDSSTLTMATSSIGDSRSNELLSLDQARDI